MDKDIKVEPTVSLVTKLTKASKNVKAVEKDGHNQSQHYTFQSEAAIKDAVKGALNAVGVQIVPSYEVTNQYDRTTAKGTVLHFVDVMGTFVITDGDASLTAKMPGSGQDSGEKAIAKACTSAQKYFYKQLFNISDRESDPDSENSKPDGGYQRQPAPQQRTPYNQLPRQQAPQRPAQPTYNQPQQNYNNQRPQPQQGPAMPSQAEVQNFITLVNNFSNNQHVSAQATYASLLQSCKLDMGLQLNQLTSQQLMQLTEALKLLAHSQYA